MPDFTVLQQCTALVYEWVLLAEKEDLAECARLLTMNVADSSSHKRMGENDSTQSPLNGHVSSILLINIKYFQGRHENPNHLEYAFVVHAVLF